LGRTSDRIQKGNSEPAGKSPPHTSNPEQIGYPSPNRRRPLQGGRSAPSSSATPARPLPAPATAQEIAVVPAAPGAEKMNKENPKRQPPHTRRRRRTAARRYLYYILIIY
jgi:hypothetical protein